jgi:hypothetical protein
MIPETIPPIIGFFNDIKDPQIERMEHIIRTAP